MKVQKIFTVIVLLLLIMGSLSTRVKATVTVQIGAGDKRTLKEGEEVTITIRASEISEGEDGINTFGGKLVYDETIFEKVTASSFSGQNNWSIAYNDEETDKKGTFLATVNTGATKAQVIGTVTLKVKTNLKSTSTKVQFTELSTVGENTINLGKIDVEFNITGTAKDETPNTSTGDNENNTNNGNKKPNNTNNGTNKIVVGDNSVKKDNTVSNKNLPQTGVQNTIIYIAIGTSAIIAVIAFIQFKKNNLIK